MALQAMTYQKDGHNKGKISTFLESAERDITHPKLKELFRKIVNGEEDG